MVTLFLSLMTISSIWSSKFSFFRAILTNWLSIVHFDKLLWTVWVSPVLGRNYKMLKPLSISLGLHCVKCDVMLGNVLPLSIAGLTAVMWIKVCLCPSHRRSRLRILSLCFCLSMHHCLPCLILVVLVRIVGFELLMI